jgi:hypothetical protein
MRILRNITLTVVVWVVATLVFGALTDIVLRERLPVLVGTLTLVFMIPAAKVIWRRPR